MKKIIVIAIVSLMAFSMAFGVSATAKTSGNTASGSGGSATVTTATATASATVQTPEEAAAASGKGADPYAGTASGGTAAEGTVTTMANDTAAADATVSSNIDDLKRTLDATDGTAVATNEETGTDELMYTTGIGAAEEDHTLLYVLSIAGAVLLVGIPVSMKLLKKAD